MAKGYVQNYDKYFFVTFSLVARFETSIDNSYEMEGFLVCCQICLSDHGYLEKDAYVEQA